MDEVILEFVELLRENGTLVSLSESVDALRALSLLGVENRDRFKNGLRSALIKRKADFRVFEELFETYFCGLSKTLRELNRALQTELGLGPREFEELLERVKRTLERLDGDISPFLRAFLANDQGEMERLLQEAARKEGADRIQDAFQLGFFAQRLADALGVERSHRGLEGIRDPMEELGLTPMEMEKIERYLSRRLRDLMKILTRFLEQKYVQRDLEHRDLLRPRYDLAHKSFYYYTEEDIRKMREVVSRLAERLKNRVSLRRKKGRKGCLDVKGTLRSNLRYGGLPFDVRFQRKRKDKPQIVILCDVSDSVLNASRFMLQFVYSVQDLYSRVRSFIFVRDVGEVTELFDNRDVHEAIDHAMRGDVIDVYTHSNFGHAFRCFYRDHLEAVNSRTTMLIIGDARNNYNSSEDWVLREIRQRAKQLIWLNPESRLTWGYGDSEMDLYRRHCHRVEECRNLEQLSKIIDQITTS